MVEKKGAKGIKLDKFDYGLLVLLAGFFLLSYFQVSNASVIGMSIAEGDIFDIFSYGQGTNFSVVVAKYILFLVIIGVLYWGFDLVMEDKPFMNFLLSAGVSYLAIAFLLKDELVVALSGFSALGILFMIALPFVAVLLVTSKIITAAKLNAQKLLIQRFIWVLYCVVVIYFLLSRTKIFGSGVANWIAPNYEGTLGSGPLAWIIFLFLLAGLYFFIWNDSYLKLVAKANLKASKANQKVKQMKRLQREADAAFSSKIDEVQGYLERSPTAARNLKKNILDALNPEA